MFQRVLRFRYTASFAATLLSALFALTTVSGCKGDTTYKDTPETKRSLDDCQSSVKNKDEYIKQLEAQLAELKRNGTGDEIVVTVQGDAMTISGVTGKGPNRTAGVEKGDARDAELYEAFLAAIRKSRGKITQCYQQALKKNASLQARTVQLSIAVSYRTDGVVKGASFNPRISPAFDTCMKSVSGGWKLPSMPRAVSFSAPLTLTPE